MISVCDTRPQKTDTHIKRITAGVNLIYYLGSFSTSTSYLTTMKPYVNSAISDIKSKYMCMDVKDFYLKNHMDRSEYIMIQISTIP